VAGPRRAFGQPFFFDQVADLCRSQFELRVGEDSQILIEDLG